MPSARAKLSAEASNVLQDALGKKKKKKKKKLEVRVGARIRLVPPTIAEGMEWARQGAAG
jgi:hypothetical protein